ncbi:DNA polymerase alpha/epsilon subunit B [Nitzschia inconspicua]|uniref:DNA polymerase alpha subunit B n=1 Tax=Nitzschia inconspicua TaxID=303405 RepID=A0A9K3PH75_9STRA|nr:DNA polymerase alpha/epsilon subunit B [Nitzschia inconspicua]
MSTATPTSAPNKKQIRLALTNAGLTKVDNDVLSKCVALASTLHLTPETMAEVWEAYSLNKQNLTELTMHQFEAYRNELIKVSQVTPATEGITNSTTGAAMVTANNFQNQLKRDSSSNMVTPPTAKRHQSGSTGKDASSSSSVDQVAIQGGSPTVGAAIKKSTIPLPKYEERTNVGQVVVAYPSNRTDDKDDRNTKAGPRCVISSSNQDVGRYNVTKPYRHMFTTMEDRASALEQLLVERKEAIMKYHGLSAESNTLGSTIETDEDDVDGVFAPLDEVNVARQEKITCIGRICNEAHEGKLNPTSVVIEGSSKTCGGARINVDLSHMQTTHKIPFSLFPGQVVALEGMNGTGRNLTAHRILEGAPPPSKTTPVRQLRQIYYDSNKQDGSPLKVMTACGPFTTSQSLDYQPFIDLMHVILEDAPDVVILTGPFVDVRQPKIQSGNVSIVVEEDEGDDAPVSASEVAVSFENLFALKVAGLIEEALITTSDESYDDENNKGFPTQFVLVPALEDATANWVYPQPPLQDRLPDGAQFLDIPGAESLEVGSLGLQRLEQVVGKGGTSAHRVHCFSNPCTFQINELVFGVMATDVLFHISLEETNANLLPGSRLRHIAQSLVQQQSYYPLFPPNKSVNLDLKQSEGWKMPCRPDVLIVPSRLSPFCSSILDSTVVLNPGHLTKGSTGGTYATMEIRPMDRYILDNATDEVELPHNVQDRIQVEVKRV